MRDGPDYPEIWLEPRPGDPVDGRQWCQDDVWTGDSNYADDGLPTKYIRADRFERLGSLLKRWLDIDGDNDDIAALISESRDALS